MTALFYPCLIASGAASLIYELLWTRILSFSFGSTSMAFAAVLAVFFLGLAVGSHVAGRFTSRLQNPLKMYGWLELGIGLYSAALLPVLFHLDHGFSWVNASGTEWQGLTWRLLLATLALGLPTFAMGATFPVLVEYLRRNEKKFTSNLGTLYGVNTLGAFFGVYLATHWLIPFLGLTGAYFVAVACNALVFALSFLLPQPSAPTTAHLPQAITSPPMATLSDDQASWHKVALLLLTVSGFTTLGYEIVWSRVLTIAMEGSLYAIGATLGAFLVGIGLGGLAWSWHTRKPRSHASVFKLYIITCLVMTAYLALSPFTLSVEGYLLKAITNTHRDLLGLHCNFAIAIAFLLPITGGLGLLFPAALSLLKRDHASKGAGTAYALNTAASVLGSVLTAAYLMNALGIEGIVWVNVLLLLGTLVIAVMMVEKEMKARWLLNGPLLFALALVAGCWPEINAKAVLLGSYDQKQPHWSGLFQSLASRFSETNRFKLYKDGVGGTITVTQTGRSTGVQNNGLPQSGRSLDPPHFNLESSMVGLFPVLHKPDAEKALVIGLGAGITVAVLRKAGIPQVDVIELEPSMPGICRYLYPKGQSPLDDSAVTLHLDDARNFLLRNRYAKHPQHWPLIASQPAHPWVSGAADLFTQDMFRLVYAALDTNGVFGQWFMPSGIDEVALRAIVNAFASVFDQVAIYSTGRGQGGIYLIGVKGDSRIDLQKDIRLFQRSELRALLELNQHPDLTDFFKYTLVPLRPGRELFTSGPTNTDGNAWIETHMPLLAKSKQADPKCLPLAATFGPTTQLFQTQGIAESLLVYESFEAMTGLGKKRLWLSKDTTQPERLTFWTTQAQQPWRAYSQLLLAAVSRQLQPDTLATLIAHTNGLRQGLLLRLFTRFFPQSPLPLWYPQMENLPQHLLRDLKGCYALTLVHQSLGDSAKHLLNSGAPAARTDSALAYILMADAQEPTLKVKSWPILDSALFDSTVAQSLKRDVDDDRVLTALRHYSEAKGYAARAKMLQGESNTQFELEVQKRMQIGEGQMQSKAYELALQSFKQVLLLKPSVLQAYLNMAQIQARLNRPMAFPDLERQVREAFPLNDIALYRLREAFEYAGAEVSQP